MATHCGPASRRPTGPYRMHLRIGLPGASVGAANVAAYHSRSSALANAVIGPRSRRGSPTFRAIADVLNARGIHSACGGAYDNLVGRWLSHPSPPVASATYTAGACVVAIRSFCRAALRGLFGRGTAVPLPPGDARQIEHGDPSALDPKHEKNGSPTPDRFIDFSIERFAKGS
jgi:hypothetical protein